MVPPAHACRDFHSRTLEQHPRGDPGHHLADHHRGPAVGRQRAGDRRDGVPSAREAEILGAEGRDYRGLRVPRPGIAAGGLHHCQPLAEIAGRRVFDPPDGASFRRAPQGGRARAGRRRAGDRQVRRPRILGHGRVDRADGPEPRRRQRGRRGGAERQDVGGLHRRFHRDPGAALCRRTLHQADREVPGAGAPPSC